METHHEIVSAMAIDLAKNEPASLVIKDRYETQGHGGMFELAEELTDEFERLNEGRAWDGDFYDAIEEFIQQKLGI